MNKKYELWFSSEEKEYKIASFVIEDERFNEYLLDTIINNLEYDISDLQAEIDLEIDNFGIIEITE